jgi:hypothetical protein
MITRRNVSRVTGITIGERAMANGFEVTWHDFMGSKSIREYWSKDEVIT